MSELIDRQALKDAVKRYADEPIKKKDRKCQAICLDMIWTIDAQPAVSPWHRVEEPPKKHGKYPVCWVENGNFYWQEAHYCYYQDGDKWVAWSSYQGDDVEITPDYWMPIEPPKEDEHGN